MVRQPLSTQPPKAVVTAPQVNTDEVGTQNPNSQEGYLLDMWQSNSHLFLWPGVTELGHGRAGTNPELSVPGSLYPQSRAQRLEKTPGHLLHAACPAALADLRSLGLLCIFRENQG